MSVSIDFLLLWLVLAFAVGYVFGKFREWGRWVYGDHINQEQKEKRVVKPYLDCPTIPYERDSDPRFCRNCGEITAHGYIAAEHVYVCKICRCETKKN